MLTVRDLCIVLLRTAGDQQCAADLATLGMMTTLAPFGADTGGLVMFLPNCSSQPDVLRAPSQERSEVIKLHTQTHSHTLSQTHIYF